ncbi:MULTISPECIES: DUF3099 domain-containing protein [Subtercola]|uniref:DUF3099 domain-containing protein n=1 Tax=Subtercola vilae TaxID=2056433 RepID=A0A4T2CEP5_9MICO|nr:MULTISPECIES: DUF3099 domain-containing protein [Subtercola]MEA9983746.1 DUF3099 domain-containing protein [Subtercola sp. RTI3]TIH40708.1 DUF3099 domain-containing protein [Subtercola vilae]
MKHDSQQHSITSLPQNRDQERHARMIRYSLAMGIRLLCLAGLLFVQGWWLLVLGVAAVVLPWFAVVIANTGSNTPGTMQAPGGQMVPVGQPPLYTGGRETGGRPE